jgi:predicted metalloprotease with PDZ domain
MHEAHDMRLSRQKRAPRTIDQRFLKWTLAALVLLAFQWSLPALAAEGEQVSHTLSFPNKNNQFVHVNTRFGVAAEQVDVFLPSWNPGSYLIRDFAGNLERFRASDSSGKALTVTKVSKHQWQIDTRGVDDLVIDYDVWAGQINVAESWIESGMALLNSAGIFIYSRQTRGLPQSIDIVIPADWSGMHTSLTRKSNGPGFIARDYDELVDSPFLLGNTVEYVFEVSGQQYSLVLSEENPFWEGQGSADDVARIVTAQQEFWGVNPFERKYIFMNLFMEKIGGLEHDHSTVMMSSPWQMRGRMDYIKWLGLVSHEFFHSWNVRRMRPRALADYDFEQEVYTRELWLAEGLTSYYDNLMLFRGGLIDVGEYFALLAEEIRIYETTPGREVRSAELASFDTWIKQYKPDGNNLNSTVSYYRKGALIAFVADAEIRRATDNRSSLDTVMRKMYSLYGPDGSNQGGYPPGAFEGIVESIAGPDARKLVEKMLKTTSDPDVDRALDWYGLALKREPDPGPGGRVPGGLGVVWKVSGGGLLAEYVLMGHSGATAGLLPEDELLAIDGLRLTPENYLDRLQKLYPEEEVELTLVRHGQLFTLPVRVGIELPANYLVVTKSDISKREKKRLEAWLGSDLRFLK